MKTKKLIVSTLSLFAMTAVLNISLVKSAVAQTYSVVNSKGTITAGGYTTPGSTNWQQCIPVSNCGGIPAIYVDIDTRGPGFTTTPAYVTSIGGGGYHGLTIGATSVYGATPTGFRIYTHLY